MSAREFLICADCGHPADVHDHKYDAYADESEWWECDRLGCGCRPTRSWHRFVDIAEYVDLDAVKVKTHRDHLLEVFGMQRDIIKALETENENLHGFAGKCDYCQRTFGPDVKIKYVDSAAAQCVECWGED